MVSFLEAAIGISDRFWERASLETTPSAAGVLQHFSTVVFQRLSGSQLQSIEVLIAAAHSSLQTLAEILAKIDPLLVRCEFPHRDYFAPQLREDLQLKKNAVAEITSLILHAPRTPDSNIPDQLLRLRNDSQPISEILAILMTLEFAD